jgi:hypothetical protein
MTLTGAEQFAVEPPPDPTQLHIHGPVPLTTEAVPEVHKPDVGALDWLLPLAGPHAPLTATVEVGAITVSVMPLVLTPSPQPSLFWISGVNWTFSWVTPFAVSEVLKKLIGPLAGYPAQFCTLMTSSTPPNASPLLPPPALAVTVKAVVLSSAVIVQFPLVLSNSAVPVRASRGLTMTGAL